MASNALKVSLLAVPLFGLLAVLAGLALLMDGVRSSFPWKFHQRNGYPTWLKNEPMELRWKKFPWVGDNTLNETIRMTFHRFFFVSSKKKQAKGLILRMFGNFSVISIFAETTLHEILQNPGCIKSSE